MICCRCKENKELSLFPKDKRKPLGVSYACKECKRIERHGKKDLELKRWKAYYAPGSDNRKRHVVRSQTRRKYGSAKKQLCILCYRLACEWHHKKYTTDDVVALCKGCHLLQT